MTSRTTLILVGSMVAPVVLEQLHQIRRVARLRIVGTQRARDGAVGHDKLAPLLTQRARSTSAASDASLSSLSLSPDQVTPVWSQGRWEIRLVNYSRPNMEGRERGESTSML